MKTRGDVHPVSHEVAVRLFDHVAQMNADPKDDPLVSWESGVALDHRRLHFDCAAHRLDDAAKFDDRAVAGAFDDAALVKGDGRVDDVATQRAQARQDPILVRSREPTVADNVRCENRRELTDFAHLTPPDFRA